MSTVLALSVSICRQESLIFAESSRIAAMLRSTTWRPSSASPLAPLACCEASAALRAISWAAAPSSLIAAATLLVRLACSPELAIDELDAASTRLTTSCTCWVAEDTSRMEPWMRSTKRLKAPASWPNSSFDCTARRRVRSPSPSAMLAMARPMSVSGRISTRISMPSRVMMNSTATAVATKAEVRKLARLA